MVMMEHEDEVLVAILLGADLLSVVHNVAEA